MENTRIRIDDTRFIFATHFSGNPAVDTYGSTQRYANIILPEELAHELIAEGFNVKETKRYEDAPEDWEPLYYVKIILKYDSYRPPIVRLVSEGNVTTLDEDSVGSIDGITVDRVRVVLNPYEYGNAGRKSLYVNTMYVEQGFDDDPWYDSYAMR